MRILATVLMCLVALPASALDVSVVNGQSRVTATIGQLEQRMDTLDTQVGANVQAVENYYRCSNQSRIYSQVEANAGRDPCVAASPSAVDLATVLGCQNGDFIVQQAGTLACLRCAAGEAGVANGNGTVSCRPITTVPTCANTQILTYNAAGSPVCMNRINLCSCPSVVETQMGNSHTYPASNTCGEKHSYTAKLWYTDGENLSNKWFYFRGTCRMGGWQFGG